jgi:hypothetical protein
MCRRDGMGAMRGKPPPLPTSCHGIVRANVFGLKSDVGSGVLVMKPFVGGSPPCSGGTTCGYTGAGEGCWYAGEG